ncbi:MAG: hypothetical protein L6Q98_07525 [Anaerolineae bacterium]|nr:hypothetical protein [Anaerolineae bacterium]NUQ04645.1 hypothetical protein [Anaerolineae bacterium]
MDESAGAWERLAAINMTMYRRIVENLNAAVGAVNLAAQSDAAAQVIWREHAVRQIMRVHNTFTAWNSLIRCRAGDPPTIPGDQRVFRLGDLLDWLAVEMRQPRKAHAHDDLRLRGRRDTLQEALILLYSGAFALGPGARLVVTPSPKGVTLGVRYRKFGDAPPSLNALLSRQSDNWRMENLTFELACVRDFLEMSDCVLNYQVEERHCALTFFVPAARQRTWTRRLRPRRNAGEPLGPAETILNETGLRGETLTNLDDDGDGDVTLDSDQSVGR